jgi:hypothetical protein
VRLAIGHAPFPGLGEKVGDLDADRSGVGRHLVPPGDEVGLAGDVDHGGLEDGTVVVPVDEDALDQLAPVLDRLLLEICAKVGDA